MIRFISIRVQNYKSIEDAILIIEPGLYRVVGASQGYSSNGSGKTSMTQAITLALYNREFSGARLDEVSNRVTGRGFKITLTFRKDDKEYVVVNNRHNNSMYIEYLGDKVTSGIKESVRFLTELLGMGYDTFCLTHFITSKTVGHITENLSSPTLFNDILQISQLKELDKKFLELSKELKVSSATLQKELASSEALSATMALANKYDIPRLRTEIATLREIHSRDTMELVLSKKKLGPPIKLLSDKLSEVSLQIQITAETIENGVCETCGTLLAGKQNIDSLKDSLKGLELSAKELEAHLETKEHEAYMVDSLTKENIRKSQEAIEALQQDLRVAEEISLATNHHNDKEASVIEENLKHSKQLERFVTYTRAQIKEGNVVKELLDNFFLIVAVKIKDYSSLINMNGMEVTILANKLGMGVTLQKGDEFIPATTLSNGEKTRLSLLVLISMLAAMKEVSNAETNYLVFDEASSSFDASGVLELEALFSYMKNMGQACFVITHGNEMNKVSFDHEVLLTKTEGISTCQVTAI